MKLFKKKPIKETIHIPLGGETIHCVMAMYDCDWTNAVKKYMKRFKDVNPHLKECTILLYINYYGLEFNDGAKMLAIRPADEIDAILEKYRRLCGEGK